MFVVAVVGVRIAQVGAGLELERLHATGDLCGSELTQVFSDDAGICRPSLMKRTRSLNS